jgi:hypothetical protein
MSALCEFYAGCAALDCVPVEHDRAIPAGVERATAAVQTRRGEVLEVTGVTVAAAMAWVADSDSPAPPEIADFLTAFCGVRVCESCGCLGLPHFFPMINSPETLCVDCA